MAATNYNATRSANVLAQSSSKALRFSGAGKEWPEPGEATTALFWGKVPKHSFVLSQPKPTQYHRSDNSQERSENQRQSHTDDEDDDSYSEEFSDEESRELEEQTFPTSFSSPHYQKFSNEGTESKSAKKEDPVVRITTNLRETDSVEAFLSNKGPKLREKAYEEKLGLTRIRKQQQELRKLQSGIKTQTFNLEQRTPSDSKNLVDLDMNLVKQAFEYSTAEPALVVNLNAIAEPLKTKPSSAKLPSVKSSTKMKGRGRKTTGMKKSKSKRRIHSLTLGAAATEKNSVHGAPVSEMDQLVKNFEDGIRLKALRKKLESSQRSLQESTHFIQAATQSWFSSS